ncbi:MAG: hypothetical protein DMG39_12960 [Acidobacteria bacterium]|nr:MAG: hypothetical protein DMG39_12960 [Acidobacteriota bacterium]
MTPWFPFPREYAHGVLAIPHESRIRVNGYNNKPQLSGLRRKIKIIRISGYGLVYWFGVRRVIKPEGASRGDEFALHFRVGFPPRKRPPGNEIDYLPIAEQDIRADHAP